MAASSINLSSPNITFIYRIYLMLKRIGRNVKLETTQECHGKRQYYTMRRSQSILSFDTE